MPKNRVIFELIDEEVPKRYSWKTRFRYDGLEFYIAKKRPNGNPSALFLAYSIPSMKLVIATFEREVLIAFLISNINRIRKKI